LPTGELARLHAGFVPHTHAACEEDGDAGAVWKPGRRIIRDYYVKGSLGRGGMGEVFLVEQRSTQTDFAVKRALKTDPQERLRFLAELRTWIDIPPYPNIVACRFFRTVDDEVVIFSEYVEGPSLPALMREGKVRASDRRLDIAITSAWGIAAIHDLGLVHQDITPNNLLIAPDGVARVNDFGLAHARASDLAHRAAGTEAYMSPEQARGLAVTGAADMWSWATVVLEMYAGLNWLSGTVAPLALECHVERMQTGAQPRMPDSLIDLLRKCLEENPKDRWPSMHHVAERLVQIYQEETGRPYPRRKPRPIARPPAAPAANRWTNWGFEWDDPRLYFPRKPGGSGAPSQPPPLYTSRTSLALQDIGLYEQVVAYYSSPARINRKNARGLLAKALAEKACVHAFLEDASGAAALFDASIKRYRTLGNEHEIAKALLNKGSVQEFADPGGAALTYLASAEILTRLASTTRRREHVNDLAKAYQNLANACDLWTTFSTAQPEEREATLRDALKLYDASEELRKWLIAEKGDLSVLPELVATYANHAETIAPLAPAEAKRLAERVFTVFGTPTQVSDLSIISALALAETVRARALRDLNDLDEALACARRAVAWLEQLSGVQGQPTALERHARGLSLQASIHEQRKEWGEADAFYARAVSMMSAAAREGGRGDLVGSLAAIQQMQTKCRAQWQAAGRRAKRWRIRLSRSNRSWRVHGS
jgi:serine/threonine protein kinase